jgi:DNA-directed RNA polymerase subunit RPC12/RpoP
VTTYDLGLKMARKQLSKKLRFDVFKRDGFKCQYCGITPEKEVLQVDHIIPVAEGGENDLDNLITSCQPCNLGKGARSLSIIPESLKEKSEKIAEQEEQIIGYQKTIMEARERKLDFAWKIADILDENAFEGYPKNNLNSILYFMNQLPYEDIVEAADIAVSQPFNQKNRQFKYFCGVCNRKIRDLKGELE